MILILDRELFVSADMKRFKTISTSFIIVIAVIFGCNVYYLISLYNSIRANVERDVLTALADADIDDLMYRAGRAQGLASNVKMQEDIDEYNAPRKAEASTYRDESVNSFLSGPRPTEQSLKSGLCCQKTALIPIRWLMR